MICVATPKAKVVQAERVRVVAGRMLLALAPETGELVVRKPTVVPGGTAVAVLPKTDNAESLAISELAVPEARPFAMEDVRPAVVAAVDITVVAAAAADIMTVAAVAAAEDPRSSNRVLKVFECTEARKTTRAMVT